MLLKIHFVFLILAVFNTIFKTFSDYSLHRNLELGIELFTFLSGLILFFLFIKPFKKRILYFSLYPLSLLISICGLLFQGFFWRTLTALVLYPIIPDKIHHKENKVILSSPQGFITKCCSCQIKESKFIILEKNLGFHELAGSIPIDYSTMKITKTNKDLILTYKADSKDNSTRTRKIKR